MNAILRCSHQVTTSSERLGADAVAILDRDDSRDACGALQLGDAEVRHADVPDLAFLLQFHQLAQGIFQRHARIGRVELIEVDTLEAQPLQAPFARLAQVRGVAFSLPDIAPRANQSALGRDHQAGRIRMQRLADQPLADVGAVRIRRVDEVHAELQRPLQHASRVLRVLGLAPDAWPGQAHRTEAEAIDAQVAADGYRAGGGRTLGG